jgi:guanylate kinase
MDRGPILDYTVGLRGNLYIVSAPSGSGKTTLLDQLMTRFDDLIFSVSFTTRKPRGQERHGVEYFFVNAADFLDMAERNEFLEWAEVHGNYYGTGRKFVEDNLNAGRSVILDIDVQGKSLVQEKMPDAVTIFLMPSWPGACGRESSRTTRRSASGSPSPRKKFNATGITTTSWSTTTSGARLPSSKP